MIVRSFHLLLATQLVYVAICQNARSYDTSDWVPITQKTSEEPAAPKKATGRVLNLDAPAQKFFPGDEYSYSKRRPNSPHHIKQKERFNVPKYDNGYKFEETQPAQQNGVANLHYFTNQEVKLPNYEQPPPLEPFRPPPRQTYAQNPQAVVPNTKEKAPAINAPNLYEQFNVPLNATSLYQTFSPGSINRELLGSIQFQPNLGAVGNVQNAASQNVQGSNQRIINGNQGVTSKKPHTENGEVQLVYVPLENLKPNQPITQDSQAIYRQLESPRYDNLIANQNVRLEAIENDFIQQALQAQKLQQQIQEGQPILLQPSTISPKPIKKRKPHQPPLSVYIEGGKEADIADVLDVLKGAKSITVQDSVQPDSPQIFIGPSSLSPVEGYTKFPLPYLNSLSGNRVERKIDQLPFFVAPLSFKTPPGFSKIPLPSPHVGSVVISNKGDLHGKRSTPKRNHLHYEENQVAAPSVSTRSPLVDSVTPAALVGHNFYNQGQFLASQQPQLLQFSSNDDLGQYRVPSTTFAAQSPIDQFELDLRNPPQASGGNRYIQNSEAPSRGQYEQENEVRSTTSRNIADPVSGQQFPADVQQIRLPSRTQSYLDTQYYDQNFARDNLSGSPPRIQEEYQNPSSTSSTKTRYEPISATVDTINITPKVTSPSPIPESEQTYAAPVRKKPQVPDVSPLELAINEFELYQINSQFQEKPKIKNQNEYDSRPQSKIRGQHQDNRSYYQQSKTEEPEYKFDPELHRFASTPATILRDSHVETTTRHTSKSRRRGRPTKAPITTTTTTPQPESDNYTVLEEFIARQPSNTDYSLRQQSTPDYTSRQPSNPNYSSRHQSSPSHSLRQSSTIAHSSRQQSTPGYSSNPNHSSREQSSPNYSLRQPSDIDHSSRQQSTPDYSSRQPSPSEHSLSQSSTPDYSSRQTSFDYSARQPSTPDYSSPLEYSTRQPSTPDYSGEPKYAKPDYSRPPEYSRERGMQYATEIEEIPAKVHVLSTATPAFAAVEEITETKPTSPRYESGGTEIEDIPARVYSLNVNENSPVYTDNARPQNQHLNQNLMDQQILRNEFKEVSPQYSDGLQYETPQQYQEQQYNVQQEIQPLVHNRGQNHEYADDNVNGERVSAYDSNLEDPSVRSLLRPNFLVPTTTDEVSYAAPKYLPTTEETSTTTTTTTTAAYEETTTRRRTRGRQRAGNRYETTTTRRSVARRRPTHSYRTTTESPRYSAETSDTKKVNTRQRFRTRGRVTPNTITERLSTTENEIYNGPTSEAAVDIQNHASGLQYEHNFHDQTILTTDPNVEISEVQTSQRPAVQYENTATTPRPAVNVRITHPVINQQYLNEDVQHHRVQSHSDVVHKKEETPRDTVRVRGRIRGRPKLTTTEATTTRRVTTSRPTTKEEDEEEFYGFFRQPNFSQSSVQQSEETTTIRRPRVQYDSQQSENAYHPEQQQQQSSFDNTNFDSTTPRFVGEIVPKYQTTSTQVEVEPDTEAPRPRIRGRVRVPHRSSSNSQRGSYEDSRPQEQVTRRSNVLRSRGKAHFKLPGNVKREEKDEDYVEGGNYPSSFFQNKQLYATAAPSFQITVDPIADDDEADQAPHPSIYRPNVVRPEEWHDASEYDAGDKGQTSGNTIENESNNPEMNSQITTTAQPIALPMKASTEETSSDETHQENIKAVEEVFETINNNFDKVSEKPEQKARRRGVWKLVKQRPLDPLAMAESQNYYSVLNSYHEIKRVKDTEDYEKSAPQSYQEPTVDESQDSQSEREAEQTSEDITIEAEESTTTIEPETQKNTQETAENYEERVETTHTPIETSSTSTTTSGQESFLDSIYQMFGIPGKNKTPPSEIEERAPTTVVSPTFPEEITEVSMSSTTLNVTEIPVETTTDRGDLTTTESDLETPSFEVEPWEMKAVRTSTSTEVSHETEICYKGRCVKSRDRKKRL